MQHIQEKITGMDWTNVATALHEKGFALIPSFLQENDCAAVQDLYNHPQCFRKTVVMERYRFGLGEYKYFDYPLPGILQTIRQWVYPQLVPVANEWMKMLGINKQFPNSFAALQLLCAQQQQTKPTVLILKYGSGGHNTLHQDLYGEIYFPLQAVVFLNEPGIDYTGGEFVLLQQTPRAQSRAFVLQPKRGEMLIFTTQFRPVKGSKGYYRVQVKHGVSEVSEGERHTLGIIFHDAMA